MNLRERAALAYLDRRSVQETELENVAVRALSSLLGESGEMTVGKIQINPTSTSVVALEVEGVEFEVTITLVSHMETGSNAGLQWDEEKVTILVKHENKKHAVRSLADLGQVFKDAPIGDEVEA